MTPYLPKYIEGTPVKVSVVSFGEAEEDIREAPLYQLQFRFTDDKGATESAGITRTIPEWQLFVALLRNTTSMNFPTPNYNSIGDLNNLMATCAGNSTLMKSTLISDFLGMNWNGSDAIFCKGSLREFIAMINNVRYPLFMPEPPRITKEVSSTPETPFEMYIYLGGFKYKEGTQEHKDWLVYFNRFIDACPGWDGPENDPSLALPGADPIVFPDFFNYTFVHFLPGGYLNGHTLRINFLGSNKFTFLNESNIKLWYKKIYPDIRPTRILDIGTGPGFTAFALAEMYPDAEVIGVDMAAANIRFTRYWNTQRKLPNIQFYHANAEDLSAFESASFDLVAFTYILHEMPAVNARKIVKEMFRLLKAGGNIAGLDVPYDETHAARKMRANSMTMGYDWHDGSTTPQGVEPYCEEYEMGLELPRMLKEAGFTNIKQTRVTYFDSAYTAAVPHGNRHACPIPLPETDFSLANLLNKHWYELGKYQTGIGGIFERDCECTTLKFTTMSEPGQLNVENFCRWKSDDKNLHINNATLVPAHGYDFNGAFSELFKFGPVTNKVNYTIVKLSDTLMAEFDCAPGTTHSDPAYCFHVLSTSRTADSDTVEHIKQFATEMGLNPANAEWKDTVQNEECPDI